MPRIQRSTRLSNDSRVCSSTMDAVLNTPPSVVAFSFYSPCIPQHRAQHQLVRNPSEGAFVRSRSTILAATGQGRWGICVIRSCGHQELVSSAVWALGVCWNVERHKPATLQANRFDKSLASMTARTERALGVPSLGFSYHARNVRACFSLSTSARSRFKRAFSSSRDLSSLA